jgi:hypothetical protein
VCRSNRRASSVRIIRVLVSAKVPQTQRHAMDNNAAEPIDPEGSSVSDRALVGKIYAVKQTDGMV